MVTLKKINIAVVGSSGYISSFLLARFGSNPAVGRILKLDQKETGEGYIDIAKAELYDYSHLSGIDYIIFTAAISSPDKCASDYEACRRINVDGTAFFIEKAMEQGCHVLFFSSDAVFGDIPGKIYDETSKTEAKTAYGSMKKAVEDRFFGNPLFRAIRLSYVVSARDRFVSYCLDCIRGGTTADVFHPFYRNCIAVSDVVDAVSWIISHWDVLPSPVLDVTGTELVSRVRMADEINRVFAGKLKYSISTPPDAFYANRPAITQMKSLYLYKYDIIKDRSFTERIQKELEGVTL
jgi:dTDP-4-dehydrorhamnose reductase